MNESAAMPVLHLLSDPKMGFRLQGRYIAPINVKFCPLFRAKFHVYRGKNIRLLKR